MKRKKENITASLIKLSTVPLVFFSILILVVTSWVVYTNVNREVEYSLNVLSHSTSQIYDLKFPGDYYMQDGVFMKGGEPIGEDMYLVNEMKEMSGVDATLFYYDTRILTTVKNKDGSLAVGTKASANVVEKVLKNGEEYFSDNVSVNGISYFGYYVPVKNSDGAIVGMSFVGRPRQEIMTALLKTISFILAAGIVILSGTLLAARMYSRQVIFSINKIREFLGRVANGETDARLDPYLENRTDELGDMGRFAVMLQTSITDLVGTDPLTGLGNRRRGNIVVEHVICECKKNGTPFALAIGDIDYFKHVNDIYGHQMGDEVLKKLAGLLIEYMEHRGFVFRWGGEEFLFIFEGMSRIMARIYLEELKEDIARLVVEHNGQSVGLHMTFGLADYTESSDPERLFEIADNNLYRGKSAGRNRIMSTI